MFKLPPCNSTKLFAMARPKPEPSVNHRYFELNVRMPRTLISLEDNIRKYVNEKVKRTFTACIFDFVKTSDDSLTSYLVICGATMVVFSGDLDIIRL